MGRYIVNTQMGIVGVTSPNGLHVSRKERERKKERKNQLQIPISNKIIIMNHVQVVPLFKCP